MKKYILSIICLFAGFGIATACYFNAPLFMAVYAGILNIEWNQVIFWLALFIGALIPILVNHYSIKRQEVIKIKASMATDRINHIYKAREVIDLLKVTIMTDYTTFAIKEFGITYIPTDPDLSAPSLRSAFIFNSHEYLSDWRLKQYVAFSLLNTLNYQRLNDILLYCSTYILNLDLIIKGIADDKMPVIGILLKNDLFDMHDSLIAVLDDYIENELFNLKYKATQRQKPKPVDNAMLSATNLFKYRSEIRNLKPQKTSR